MLRTIRLLTAAFVVAVLATVLAFSAARAIHLARVSDAFAATQPAQLLVAERKPQTAVPCVYVKPGKALAERSHHKHLKPAAIVSVAPRSTYGDVPGFVVASPLTRVPRSPVPLVLNSRFTGRQPTLPP